VCSSAVGSCMRNGAEQRTAPEPRRIPRPCSRPLSEAPLHDLKAICPLISLKSAALEPLLRVTLTPAFRGRQGTSAKKINAMARAIACSHPKRTRARVHARHLLHCATRTERLQHCARVDFASATK
jgi:hypothetical protein